MMYRKKKLMRHKARLMHIKDSLTFMWMVYADSYAEGFRRKNLYAETYAHEAHQANPEAYAEQSLA